MTHDQEKRAAEHAARIKSSWHRDHGAAERHYDPLREIETTTVRVFGAIADELSALRVLIEDLAAKIGAK